MTFLVDANVLSEPTRSAPNPQVVEWLKRHESDIVIDPIVLGELTMGVQSLAAGRKRAGLERWLDSLRSTVECIPWDAAVGQRWATLVVGLRKHGRVMPLLDSMIVATALTHDLVLATRNVRDFSGTGVRTINPFVK